MLLPQPGNFSMVSLVSSPDGAVEFGARLGVICR
jgi:hypothetical protein